ncbi:MAG TPA: ABC transporter permease [Candidatus Acidoferrales bacterium]|nr:ABC transporter permease [Candidatus Acidoferrales bacterium]
MWLRNAIRNWRRKQRADAELDEEVRGYADLLAEEKIRSGMGAAQARREARMELGGVEQVKEQVRGVRAGYFLETLWQDLRHGARMLRRTPGFTVVAVLTLALGIGANTAIFSVINSVLFKPLPVEAPQELVDLYNTPPKDEAILQYIPLAYPDYVDFRDQSKVLAGLLGFAPTQVALERQNESELIPTEEVTGNYFQVLGLRLKLGRGFDLAQERTPGGDPAAVLSYAMWQNRFASDPNIIGKTITLNEHPMTIVGVAPRDFHGLMRVVAPGLWVPISMDSALHLGNPVDDRGSQWLFAMGRLKPGASLGQAQAELQAIAARLIQMYPKSNKERSAVLLPASQVKIFPEADKALYAASVVLLGFAGLILLIACANIAGMLMARAAGRRREIAIRMALGGGRLRLVRQLLTENLLLSLLGGAAALLITSILNRTLSQALANISTSLPIGFGLTLDIDGRVLGFTVAAALGTTFLFGLIPALKTSKHSLADALKEETGAATGSHGKHRLLNTLVVGQVTISLMLLICAGLSLRSLWNASRVNPGFDPSNLATAAFNPSLAGYNASQAKAFYEQLTARIGALPGVQNASDTDRLPLTFNVQIGTCAPEGKENDARAKLSVATATVNSNYFKTMRIPVLRGRAFDNQDNPKSTPVVMVNQTLANRFWPGQNPVGKRISFGEAKKYYEVVGVAADGKYITLGEAPRAYVYRAMRQAEIDDRIVIARTMEDPRAALASIRQISRQLDPKVPVTNLETVQQATSVALLLPRAGGTMFGLFGLLGLILASMGLYGVIAYTVAQRTHEIGIRIALGASSQDIARLVMRRGLGMALAGVALGLAGAFALTRVLSIMLYGISATDPLTFAVTASFLILVSTMACYVPTRRAMKVDPMVALRYE